MTTRNSGADTEFRNPDGTFAAGNPGKPSCLTIFRSIVGADEGRPSGEERVLYAFAVGQPGRTYRELSEAETRFRERVNERRCTE